MIRYITFAIMIFLLAFGIARAQDDGTTTTTTGSNFASFIVMCETQAVVNLDGTLQAGVSIYFQLFTGTQGTGTALSGLRRVDATGTFTYSEVVPYSGGTTIPFGSFGSAYVTMSRTGNPNNSLFNEYVDDLQDGCADPINPLGVSSEAGTVESAQSPGTTTGGTSNILSPFGGVINPNYTVDVVPDVVIGAREPFLTPRQETAGLIFAECDDFAVAEPGIIYDSDVVIVFWSWFARTEQQVQDHIDHVQYWVAYYDAIPVPNVQVSDIQLRNGRYWVFYTSRLGNLVPGKYDIQYKVTWDEAISDGFASYGPDTNNERLESSCTFDVLPNPDGQPVAHSPWPAITNP